MGKPLRGEVVTKSGMPAGQLRAELDWLINLFRREKVTSYLEIGARSGDTFWEISKSLPPGSRVVAVDLPGAKWGYPGTNAPLFDRVTELKDLGYDATAFLGDSHSMEIENFVKARAPFDAVLIDGDHTLDGVTRDWLTYGRMARLVAFHDLAWKRTKDWPGTRIQVPEFWASLKKRELRMDEICTESEDCGIGVVWRE